MTAADPGLLAAVLEAPADDAPRLIYADWLDENGQPERAEFIRVQVGLARLATPTTVEIIGDPSVMQRYGLCKGREVYPSHPDSCGKCPSCRGWLNARRQNSLLRRRERELLTTHWWQWVDVSPAPATCLNFRDLHPPGPAAGVYFRRGFVAEVRLTPAAFVGGPCGRCGRESPETRAAEDAWRLTSRLAMAWLDRSPETRAAEDAWRGPCSDCGGTGRTPALAPALFAAHPVERVVLTDREPSNWTREDGRVDYVWTVRTSNQIETPADLPRQIFDLLTGGAKNRDNWVCRYSTRGAALDALFDGACVAWGRGQAGLPPGAPKADAAGG